MTTTWHNTCMRSVQENVVTTVTSIMVTICVTIYDHWSPFISADGTDDNNVNIRFVQEM